MRTSVKSIIPIFAGIPKCDQLEATMVEASREFLQTGEIPDALLQCFGQNGKWLGETAASEFVDDTTQRKLAEHTIPESRRTITNENRESILLTSFMLEEEPDDDRLEEEYLEEEDLPVMKDPILVLPWHEIRGMCQVAIHRNLSCPKLQRFNPNYTPVNMSALTIQLPELAQVGSIIWTAEHISLPKLTQARSLHFKTARHIDAPSLQTVENLQLGPAFSARFPLLGEVSGALLGYAIREFSAPILEAVNRRKTGHEGLVLTEAWTIDAHNLKHVGKRLDASSAETFCPRDLTVDGKWQMHPNAQRLRARLAMKGPDIEL